MTTNNSKRSIKISESAYERLIQIKDATGIPITRQIDNYVFNKQTKKQKGE